MARALIGLGSNIEPRLEYLKMAVRELRKAPLKVLALSGVYETEPVDVKEQAAFLNAALLLETDLSPLGLLRHLQTIEAKAGKAVIARRGPRTLDLDLWGYDQLQMSTDELCLPHERLLQRTFALIPLAQVAPEWRHPSSGQSAADALAALPKPWPRVELQSSMNL